MPPNPICIQLWLLFDRRPGPCGPLLLSTSPWYWRFRSYSRVRAPSLNWEMSDRGVVTSRDLQTLPIEEDEFWRPNSPRPLDATFLVLFCRQNRYIETVAHIAKHPTIFHEPGSTWGRAWHSQQQVPDHSETMRVVVVFPSAPQDSSTELSCEGIETLTTIPWNERGWDSKPQPNRDIAVGWLWPHARVRVPMGRIHILPRQLTEIRGTLRCCKGPKPGGR